MENEEQPRLRCQQCRREIALGEDLITVEKGVLGPRGVVPLGNVLIFCSEKHVREYFANGNDDVNSIPPRLPY